MQTTAELLQREISAQGKAAAIGQWHPMDGGRTNAIWRISGAQGDYVCKLFHPQTDNPLFPNDPAAEVLALTALEGKKIAPRLYASVKTTLGTCLIYSFQQGEPWHGRAEPVAQLLRRLHGLTPPVGLRKIASGTEALWRMTREITDKCTQVPVGLFAAPRTTAIATITQPCFLHGDAVAGNILIGNTGARLIDWQCPAIGDPCEDLAVFLSPAMQRLYGGRALDATETSDFLVAYGDHQIAQRYRALAPHFHRRMAAYCLWRSQQGEPDYYQAMTLELAALDSL